ncbi:MAG: CDP-glucose 4,6-dehydratase [Pseudolysinimonas sp.]
MRYLVTGHTGFKGSWLTLMLRSLGHEVAGIALDPVEGALYTTARVDGDVADDRRIDIRDADAIARAVADIAPEVVLHLAAQPLVRLSYREPRLTYETNVDGTLNLLQAVSATPSVRAHVVVTTDKVYRNDGRAGGYAETDPLGAAADPYSTSKAMADLLTQSWAASSDGPPLGIVRGGNVIGGGDVSEDRLLPDLVRTIGAGHAPVLRNPRSVRPWQHVLDCLDGYLTVADALLAGRGEGAWNFGPRAGEVVTVAEVAEAALAQWPSTAGWTQDAGQQPHEAALLSLDSGKATRELGWTNLLPYPDSLTWVIDWHRAVAEGGDPREVTLRQVDRYRELREASR